jgi:hypothetical protein
VQEMFGQVLSQRIQSGAVEQAIIRQVDKLIEDAASDVFRSYGDVGKAIKEQFAKAVMPNLKEIGDIPTYHQFVTQRLKMSVQNFYDNRIAQVIDKEMADLLEEIPEQLNLSWFVQKLLNSAKESRDEDYEGQITLNIEHDGKWLHISMDKEQNKEKYRCAYRIDARKDDDGQYRIYAAKIDDESIATSKIIGPFYSFEKILMHVYALKGSIIADKGFNPDDYETGWYND